MLQVMSTIFNSLLFILNVAWRVRRLVCRRDRVLQLAADAEAEPSAVLDVGQLLRSRLRAAVQLRRALRLPSDHTDVYRLCNRSVSPVALPRAPIGMAAVPTAPRHVMTRKRLPRLLFLLAANLYTLCKSSQRQGASLNVSTACSPFISHVMQPTSLHKLEPTRVRLP